MNQKDRQVLEQFASRVRQHHPEASIWAFGSRVRNEAAPESDLDICVVIDELDEKADRFLSEIAWEVGFESDIVISVIPFSADEFNTGPLSVSPLVRIIRQEGVAA
jgi:predicted nucleotidyltransferase